MTIALSVKRIADSIYARSALDAAQKGIDIPAALTRRHDKALRRVIYDVIAEVVASLGCKVLSCDISEAQEAGADIVNVDYAVDHADAEVACLRINIETAIVCSTLARLSTDTPALAQWYAALARLSDRSLPTRIKRSC